MGASFFKCLVRFRFWAGQPFNGSFNSFFNIRFMKKMFVLLQKEAKL
jgi:hypothetical protein